MLRRTTFTSSALPCKLLPAVLRTSLTALFCSAVLFALAGEALAVARSAKEGTTEAKKVVTNVTVTGPSVKAHQWGFMEVQLQVTKTETTAANGKPVVTIHINKVSWPIFPNHTTRSIYINQQALPLLQGETLQLQASSGTKLINIAGATHTTVAWRTSLQAALAKAETP
jgi:hypothetical protein